VALFEDNVIYIYIFTCLTIINYSTLKSTQKIIILYLISYGLAFFNVLSTTTTIILLITFTFLYLEFLFDDNEKMRIIRNFFYKVGDYIILMFFQYYLSWLILAIVISSETINKYAYLIIENNNTDFYQEIGIKCLSLPLFIITISKISSQRFELNSISTIINNLSPTIYNINLKDIDPRYWDILCLIEDKSFLHRSESYNFFSIEFIRYKKDTRRSSSKQINYKYYIKNTMHIRGYSTLEMQFMRTMFITHGLNKTFKRKIFEILYSSIFLKSLKNYYLDNSYTNSREYFKQYILYIYLHNVNTRVANIKYDKFNYFFKDDEGKVLSLQQNSWKLEDFYIACIGLSHRPFNSSNVLKLYPEILSKYSLDTDYIVKKLKELEGK